MKCRLVNKGCNQVIDSEVVWESILIREFGQDKTRQFLSKNGALETLRDALYTDDIFRPLADDFQHSVEYITLEDISKEVVENTSLRQMQLFDYNSPPGAACFYRKSEHLEQHKYQLKKLPSLLSEFVDIFKPHFEVSRYCNLLFVSGNWEMILTTCHCGCRVGPGSIDFVTGHYSNVRCIIVCTNFETPTMRIVFPSRVNRMTIKLELEKAIRLDTDVCRVNQLLDREPWLVDPYEFDQNSSFAFAIEHRANGEILDSFVRRGAFVSEETFLLAGVSRNQAAMEICLRRGISVNCQNWLGETVLGMMITDSSFMYPNVARYEVEWLIQRGADVSLTTAKNGTTLLMIACEIHRIGVVKVLASVFGEVNKLNNRKQSALQFALKRKSFYRVIKILMEHGADPNVEIVHDDGMKSTALIELASRRGKRALRTIRLLIEYGADVKAKDSFDRTALLVAESDENVQPEIVALLKSSLFIFG